MNSKVLKSISQNGQNMKTGCGGPILENDLSLKNLLKKIGKGPKLAQDLSQSEAKAALLQILEIQAPLEQIGAFLIALRIKGETAEELAGLIQALQENTLQIDFPKMLELASAHDGKKKSLVLTPFVALILACAEIPTLVTGGRDVPTKKGICAALIFDALGFSTQNSAEKITHDLKTHHIAYWDISDYCPKLEKLKNLRHNLGLRTVLNTVEKVIRPTLATHMSTGVFHGPYLFELARACQILNYQNVLCVQASEASTDLPLKKRSLYRHINHQILSEQLEINPEIFGMKRSEDVLFTEISAQENVARVLEALKNQKGLVYDALIYNAGVQFWFSEKCANITAGINLAADIITSGAVLKKIKDLSFTS